MFTLSSPFDTILYFANQPTLLPHLDKFRTLEWTQIYKDMQWLTAIKNINTH